MSSKTSGNATEADEETLEQFDDFLDAVERLNDELPEHLEYAEHKSMHGSVQRVSWTPSSESTLGELTSHRMTAKYTPDDTSVTGSPINYDYLVIVSFSDNTHRFEFDSSELDEVLSQIEWGLECFEDDFSAMKDQLVTLADGVNVLNAYVDWSVGYSNSPKLCVEVETDIPSFEDMPVWYGSEEEGIWYSEYNGVVRYLFWGGQDGDGFYGQEFELTWGGSYHGRHIDSYDGPDVFDDDDTETVVLVGPGDGRAAAALSKGYGPWVDVGVRTTSGNTSGALTLDVAREIVEKYINGPLGRDKNTAFATEVEYTEATVSLEAINNDSRTGVVDLTFTPVRE